MTTAQRDCKYTLNRRRPVASGEPEERESRERSGESEVNRMKANGINNSAQGVMELRVTVKLGHLSEVKEAIKTIKEIEKEYSCNCTLLEIRID